MKAILQCIFIVIIYVINSFKYLIILLMINTICGKNTVYNGYLVINIEISKTVCFNVSIPELQMLKCMFSSTSTVT